MDATQSECNKAKAAQSKGPEEEPKYKKRSGISVCTRISGPIDSENIQEARPNLKREFVEEKLRKAYPRLSSEERNKLALTLSDRQRMKDVYFGRLLGSIDEAGANVEEEKKDLGEEIRSSRDRHEAAKRIAGEFNYLRGMQIKLVLCQLSPGLNHCLATAMNKFIKRFDYGPFHAALVFGNVVFEWNDDGVVQPRTLTEEEDWVFKATIHQPDGQEDRVIIKNLPLRRPQNETEQHFDMIVKQLNIIQKEKIQVVEALVTVAVKYNTKYTYNPLTSNCQHFVRDCLHVMGITDQEGMFEENIKNLCDLLAREGLQPTDDVCTHSELDVHVKKRLKVMTRQQVELCICQYLIFHTLHKAQPKNQAWKCSGENCLLSNAESQLERMQKLQLDSISLKLSHT